MLQMFLMLYLSFSSSTSSNFLGSLGMPTFCPSDRYWDYTTEKCKECSSGFYGKNCSRPCRYPNYGLNCQYFCKCNERVCSNVLGCQSNNIDVFNMVQKLVKQECPIGFHGPNCSRPCRFPNYGYECQKMCSCNETDCNNIVGCTVEMDTHLADQFEKTSLRIGIIASTIVGILLIIMSITVLIVLMKNRIRRVFTTENRNNITYI